MSQPIPSRTIEKAIVKGAKKAIAASSLNPSTRSGNKELSHWATYLSNQEFSSLESAHQYGETLGQKIVELSQATQKSHLDGGIIRQLRSQKYQPAIVDIPASKSSPKSPQATPEKSVTTPVESEPDITTVPLVTTPVEISESSEEILEDTAISDDSSITDSQVDNLDEIEEITIASVNEDNDDDEDDEAKSSNVTSDSDLEEVNTSA